ncbi:MAG TPA: hypothetical protein VFR78_14495 [Pyrinomonadaceae bacterium]|nr:hypothetical protein [Pyrinomonadaceae bacterium]
MSALPILIKKVSNSSGDALKGCYFVIGPTVIEFYDKNPTVVGALDGDVRLNTEFNLVLKDDPGNIWKLKVTSIAPREIEGRFSCTNALVADPADVPGSGTFHAQASGTGAASALDSAVAKGKAV